MTDTKGWIKLHRKTLENNACVKDADHLAIWCWILLKASYSSEEQWFGGELINISEGQFLTTLREISDSLKINPSKVNRVLHFLESEKQIEKRSSNKKTLITVVNWDNYQLKEKQFEKQEKPKVSEKTAKHRHGEYGHVLLTVKQFDKLVSDYGESKTQDAIKFLDEYIEMKGYKAKNHNLAMRKWVFDAVERDKKKNAGYSSRDFNKQESQLDYLLGSIMEDEENENDIKGN